MKKPYVAIMVVTLLLVGLFTAVAAQEDVLSGLVQPLVIDVEQQVPTDVVVAVPVDGGEFVTVTTPITVNVALRVSIDGPEVVTVEPQPDDEARVTISALAAMDDQLVDNNGLDYQIEIPDGVEIIQMSIGESTSNDFEAVGEFRNTSDAVMDYGVFHFTLYDSNGDIIAVEDGYVTLDEVAPGGTSPFELFTYGIPYEDVASYLIQMEADFDE